MKLPLKNGSYHTITSERYEQLQSDYPDINIKQELTNMRNWLETHPKRGKILIDRFIINWLNKPNTLPKQPYTASHTPFADLNYK